MYYFTKTKTLFANIRSFIFKDRLSIVISTIISITVTTVLLVVVLVSGSIYTLSAHVKTISDLIPGHSKYFFEVKDFERFYKNVRTSRFGKEIVNSREWQQLFSTPEFRKITNLLYFIELKAGHLLTYKDLPSFFDGPLGLAFMGDGSYLFTAQTNMRTRVGLALYNSFKAEKLSLKKDTFKTKNKSKNKLKNRYKDIYITEDFKLNNIVVSKVKMSGKNIYLVLLGKYLIASDNLSTLKISLKLGSGMSNRSLHKKRGIQNAIAHLSRNKIHIYINTEQTVLHSIVHRVIPASGLSFILDCNKKKILSGDIFAIGYNSKKSRQLSRSSTFNWNALLPVSSAATLYSNTLGINDFVEAIELLDTKYSTIKKNIVNFFKANNLHKKDMYQGKRGTCFMFHKVTLANKNLYPLFSIGYRAKNKNKEFAKSIFKTRGSSQKKYQNTSFTLFNGMSSQFYKAAMVHEKDATIISSHIKNTKEIISAKNGNRSVLKDLKTFRKMKKFKKSANHLIINIHTLVKSIKYFYNYGAAHNSAYTYVTVDKDIMPLFNPIKKYRYLHIALGNNKGKSGKMILSKK